MNVDAFIKGIQRANSSREQRQGKRQDANAVTSEPVLTKCTPALADASVLDLEQYRVEQLLKQLHTLTTSKGNE